MTRKSDIAELQQYLEVAQESIEELAILQSKYKVAESECNAISAPFDDKIKSLGDEIEKVTNDKNEAIRDVSANKTDIYRSIINAQYRVGSIPRIKSKIAYLRFLDAISDKLKEGYFITYIGNPDSSNGESYHLGQTMRGSNFQSNQMYTVLTLGLNNGRNFVARTTLAKKESPIFRSKTLPTMLTVTLRKTLVARNTSQDKHWTIRNAKCPTCMAEAHNRYVCPVCEHIAEDMGMKLVSGTEMHGDYEDLLGDLRPKSSAFHYVCSADSTHPTIEPECECPHKKVLRLNDDHDEIVFHFIGGSDERDVMWESANSQIVLIEFSNYNLPIGKCGCCGATTLLPYKCNDEQTVNNQCKFCRTHRRCENNIYRRCKYEAKKKDDNEGA